MFWDFAAILLLLGLAAIGFRLGARLNLVATLGLGAAVAAGIALGGTVDLPLPAFALTTLIWIGCHVAIWVALRRRTAGRSVVGGGLGLVQGSVALVLLTGALGSIAPGSVASARVYPPVAAAGSQLAASLPEAELAFPAPVRPEPDARQQTQAARPIDWAEAKAFDARPTRYLTGTVQAADRAPMGFEVDGRVASVEVEIGDSFARGDILATLDSPTLEIASAQAQSALVEAEAMEREAELDFDRQSTLYDRGVVSKAARDAARARYESAESRLAVARARVADAHERLEDTRLVAPYDGQIAARMIEPAQLYRPGQPAFEIQSSASGFEIDVTVPETVIGRVNVGSEHLALLLDGSGSKFAVRLTEIGSRAERASGFPVTFAVVGPGAPLRAGMAAEVAMRLDPLRANSDMPVAVPLSAIHVGEAEARVAFVYDPEAGTVIRRDVALAGTEDGDALISSGLAPGEIVATAGLPFLKDGMTVSLVGRGIARYDR